MNALPALLADIVELAHRAFAPIPEEVALAGRIVDAFEAGLAAGVGAIAVDGRMVDAPGRRSAPRPSSRRTAISAPQAWPEP